MDWIIGIVAFCVIAALWLFMEWQKMKREQRIYDYDAMVGMENLRRNMTKLYSSIFPKKSIWREEEKE